MKNPYFDAVALIEIANGNRNSFSTGRDDSRDSAIAFVPGSGKSALPAAAGSVSANHEKCQNESMVQLRVTAIPEVAIHWSSGFSRFRYRLDAGFRRRETSEYLKRQDGRKFTLIIHPGNAVVEQRPDTGLKAPPALGGSAVVARPTRRQIFAVNCTAPARHDCRAGPGHPTSEMIQEDMKILEPRRAQSSRREEYPEEKHDRGE